MARRLDRIDGGFPAVFNGGPKHGHVGVVTPNHLDEPPDHLVFLDGALVYCDPQPAKVKAGDEKGQPRRYDGVVYSMDKTCPMAIEAKRIDDTAKAEAEVLR